MPVFTQSFLTDKLDRLTSFTASNLTETYSYDLTGNRVTLAIEVAWLALSGPVPR